MTDLPPAAVTPRSAKLIIANIRDYIIDDFNSSFRYVIQSRG